MVSHFICEPEFCNAARGWEKGQVEKNVRDARHRDVATDAGVHLARRVERLARAAMHGAVVGDHPRQAARNGRRPVAQERSFLMPRPRSFDGFVEHTKRVSPTCLMHCERNRYSVPASGVGRSLPLPRYPGCRFCKTCLSLRHKWRRLPMKDYQDGTNRPPRPKLQQT
jgi:hypothetical protein